MGYDSVKCQNQNLHARQYNYNCQNDRTKPNTLKTYKQTQNNARMGPSIPNLKNIFFQKLGFFPVKISGRALTGRRALAPILNA